MKKAGIRAAKTLTRWHQRGLIPKPEIEVHPSGRGKTAFWPEWVIDRCIRIKSLVASGRSLEEISQLLIRIESEPRGRRRSFRETEAAYALEKAAVHFVAIVSDKIATFSSDIGELRLDLRSQLDHQIAQRKTRTKILKFARKGANVVLVISGGALHVLPDFLVSHELSNDTATPTPIVVIPISAEIREAFAGVTSGIPDQPTVRPAQFLVEETDDGERRVPFNITRNWDYKIDRKRRRSKKK